MKEKNKNSGQVPLGDKKMIGERDDMLNPQASSKCEVCVHLQRYKFATEKIKGKILDLGCGTGYSARMLYKNGNEVYGIDNSPEAIAYAEKNYPGPKYICCSAEELPFGDSFFDAITAFEIIEHVSNPEKVIEEIYRVLKPQGNLFISTPNPRNLENRLKHFLLRKPYPKKIYMGNIYHRKEFYYEEFLDLLKKKDFKVKFKYGQTLLIFHREVMYLLKKLPLFCKIPIYLGYYFPKFADTIVVWAKK